MNMHQIARETDFKNRVFDNYGLVHFYDEWCHALGLR